MSALLAALRKRGWVVKEHAEPVALLPNELRARYPAVPPAVIDFLGRLEVCHNAEENVWFLTAEDYRKTDDDGFRWNEYEVMSLDSRKGDPSAAARIRAFWNDHLPIMLAVHSDYDYLAVRVAEPKRGPIVHGVEEWENPSRIAPTFEAFLQSFAAEATSNDPEYPYSVFL